MKRVTAEAVREYIMDFPELKDGCLLIDFMGDNPVEYTIETVPCEPIVKKYTDGSTIRQYEFIFASREYFSEDVITNIENLGFYQKFEEWINERNEKGILPDLGDDAVRPIVIVDTSDKNAKCYKRDYSIIPNSEGDNINVYTYSGNMKAHGEKVEVAVETDDNYETITVVEA